jgi:hypothetical protein
MGLYDNRNLHHLPGDYCNEFTKHVHMLDHLRDHPLYGGGLAGFASLTNEELSRLQREEKIRTVEERYCDPQSKQFATETSGTRKEIKQEAACVSRINQMVGILNTTNETAKYKQAMNEIYRILYHKIVIAGGDANPDLLA